MPTPVIVSAVRTAIGRSYKGALVNTSAEVLATTALQEAIRRAGVDSAAVDDVIFAESLYGGGDLARYAAVASAICIAARTARSGFFTPSNRCARSVTARSANAVR